MKKLIAGGAAVALALSLAAISVAPANAFPYYPHYHHHYGYGYGYGYGPGAGLAAGVLGFAAGAAIAGAAARNDDGDHVNACYDAYKSYDERTDTYLGYDGYRHRCNL